MNPTEIDTSPLLTMLGLIAAVWAVVPNTARLSFRLSLNWFDWLVIWLTTVTIHLVVLQPIFPNMELFSSALSGKGGQSAIQYLLFLFLTIFVYCRLRKMRLTRWNLGLFDDLTSSLLRTGKLDELVELLHRHLESAMKLAGPDNLRTRYANIIRPPAPNMKMIEYDDDRPVSFEYASMGWPAHIWFSFRECLAKLISPSLRMQSYAEVVVTRLLSSRSLVSHLAIVRPYFCLQIMEHAMQYTGDFQNEFFHALLANDDSALYSELKNNGNYSGSVLPDENRILRFYCADVDVAARLEVYQSVGEAVLARIDADASLEKKLNGRLLTFQDVGKYRDPVYAGICFFRIMVLEGLHQSASSHLWLHYMSHFTRKLIDRAREVRPEDKGYEFPTPLSYLLYEIVDTTVEWINDAEALTKDGAKLDFDEYEGNHAYISFEATKAMGPIIYYILMSSRVPQALKEELLCVALNALRNLEGNGQLAPLANEMRANLIKPNGLSNRYDYLYTFKQCFDAQDHVLRSRFKQFNEKINSELKNYMRS